MSRVSKKPYRPLLSEDVYTAISGALHDNKEFSNELSENYLRYAMSVIVSRALPDARDGLKPSQRRILFAMRALGLSPNAKTRKCAKICGDTSGDWHPHGESVIYPTLVRMAQSWSQLYPLIIGKGNFGSLDADPPAAMRYTEAKLSHWGMKLMEDIDKDTVDYVSNYDETKKEPVVFSAAFPSLICNGSSGIAVGMATNIPPHNLEEISKAIKILLDNPNATVEDLMEYVEAPDFPTGGIICGTSNIKSFYESGHGKVLLRGNCEYIEEGKENHIVISSIPYGVDKSKLVAQIADLVHNKVIPEINDIRDESDGLGVYVAIFLKKGEIAQTVINKLFKHSDLQISIGLHMLALDNGIPRRMSLKDVLAIWIKHRIKVITRRTEFELRKTAHSLEITNGQLISMDHLDDVIHTIKNSTDKKDAAISLCNLFSLTQIQSNAILDMKMYQLTGLERDKLLADKNQLEKKLIKYKSILNNKELVHEIIRNDLDEIIETLPEEKRKRKSEISNAWSGSFDLEELIPNDIALIALSKLGYIKRVPSDTFKEQHRGGQGIFGFETKADGDYISSIYKANLHDQIFIFSRQGKCFKLRVWEIPEVGRRSQGKTLATLLSGHLDGQDSVSSVLPIAKNEFEDNVSILFATKNGLVKRTSLSQFAHVRKTGIIAINLDEGDEVIATYLVTDKDECMLFTLYGMGVRFNVASIRNIGRSTRGVKGINLSVGDHVIACQIVRSHQSLLIISEKGFGKRSLVENFRKTARASKGVRTIITNNRNGKVVNVLESSNEDYSVIIATASGKAIRIPMNTIRIQGRVTQGVKLVQLQGKSDVIVSAGKMVPDTIEPTESSDV